MSQLTAPQATLSRHRRFTEGLKQVEVERQAKEDAAKLEIERQDADREAKMQEAMLRTVSRKKEVRKELELQEEVYHENFFNTITSLMAYITTEAVLLDDGVNKDVIYSSYKEAYEYLYENDIISLQASPTFEKLGGRVASYVATADRKLTDEEIANIVSNIYVNDPEMIDPLTSNVQDKVATSVEEEKKAILARQNLTEDQQHISGYLSRRSKAPIKPLFRKLLEDGVSSSINLEDPTSLSEEATKMLMEDSLDQAVCIYTLLETLHTSKLMEIPRKTIEEFINYK